MCGEHIYLVVLVAVARQHYLGTRNTSLVYKSSRQTIFFSHIQIHRPLGTATAARTQTPAHAEIRMENGMQRNIVRQATAQKKHTNMRCSHSPTQT